uniref:Uncharacterized protein n=1 Tax=Cacopsylla melanoneura TaxID=428564 RepID=A0A8D8M6W3_9HEMI
MFSNLVPLGKFLKRPVPVKVITPVPLCLMDLTHSSGTYLLYLVPTLTHHSHQVHNTYTFVGWYFLLNCYQYLFNYGADYLQMAKIYADKFCNRACGNFLETKICTN